MKPRRWQDCRAFVRDLEAHGYLVEGRPVMSDGIYLYMYELWRDGARFALTALKRKGYVTEYPKATRTAPNRKSRRRNDAT